MFNIREPEYGSRGFYITFENGCTVSVQFGKSNYCANRFEETPDKCPDAEIAAWDANDDWIRGSFFGIYDVYGWATPAQVLQFMNEVAARAR